MAGQAAGRDPSLALRGNSPKTASQASLGNPTLFQDPGGRIWLFYVSLTGHYWNSALLHVVFSDDGGRSWAPPRMLSSHPGLMVRHPPLAVAGGSLAVAGLR